jgi:hypothetical protein
VSLGPLELPEVLPTDLRSLPALIERLTWSFLETSAQPFDDGEASLGAASRLSWRHVGGCGRRAEQSPTGVPLPWLLGLAHQQCVLAYSLQQKGGVTEISVGLPPELADHAGRALGAMLDAPALVTPGARPSPGSVARGCLSGVPSAPPTAAPDGAPRREDRGWIDPVLESLRGEDFSLVVLATPEPLDEVHGRRARLRAAATAIDRQHLKVASLADADRTARRAAELIDQHLRRIEEGAIEGLWRTSVIASARGRAVVRHILALIAGASSQPGAQTTVPVRVHDCSPSGAWPVHSNVLTSAELSRLFALPARDRSGFAVVPAVRFDVGVTPGGPGFRLGEVLDGDSPSGQAFTVEGRLLCRHALVAGHTGSGKSTTIRRLLSAAQAEGVPFLVLDPVKPVEHEYRDLLASSDGVLYFRVGAPPTADEAPFQFNPLAFPAGFSLFTHIDHLKAAFTAAFGLSPPAPYLLENAIFRTYQRRGWDLGTGTHPRAGSGRDPLIFPRLSDLLVEVERVVESAGYGDEVARNLKAALKTRVGNLCLGPKGLSLDTYEQVPDALLYGSPVILGLAAFGSHEEQALLMGMIMTRLFEYRTVQGMPPGEGLRHLLVVEEAHRLLKRGGQRSSEEGNMAFQAVQMFSAMIAEIRAYGQGFVVAEQLPSLLAEEVVKQTGLKVIHRLTPREDRDVVGDAMALSEEQKLALCVLSTGEAVAFMEGMDGAVRVRVDRAAATPAARATSGPLARLKRRPPAEFARVQRAVSRGAYAGALSDQTTVHAADLVLTAAGWGKTPPQPPRRGGSRSTTRCCAGRRPTGGATPTGPTAAGSSAPTRRRFSGRSALW